MAHLSKLKFSDKQRSQVKMTVEERLRHKLIDQDCLNIRYLSIVNIAKILYTIASLHVKTTKLALETTRRQGQLFW